jgi:signal transduction histidine kinase/streptogramin lyase/ActR/RegA family two-component response regulator
LESELAKTIVKDPLGFILVGTDQGLYRYDGADFKQCNQHLPSKKIKAFLRTSKGKIYGTTDNAFVEIVSQPASVKINVLRNGLPPKDTLLQNPQMMYEDKENEDIYFSDDNAIFRYRKGKLKKFIVSSEKITDWELRSASFFQDANKNLYAILEKGNLFRLNKNLDSFESVETIFPLHTVSFAIATPKGEVYVSSREGLYEMAFEANGKMKAMTLITQTLDASWIMPNPDGSLFVGTWGSGFYKMKRSAGKHSIVPISEYTAKNINYFYFDNPREIWFATNTGIGCLTQYYFYKDLEHSSRRITKIVEAVNGKIYFSTGDTIFEAMATEDGYVANMVYTSKKMFVTLFIPLQEGIWMNNSSEPVVSFVGTKGVEKSYNLDSFGREVTSLTIGNEGSLWVTQSDNLGIVRIKPDGSVINYEAKKGINSPIVLAKKNRKGEIFCSSYDNAQDYLYKYDIATDKFVNISVPIPFKHTEKTIYINDFAISKEGVIWIASAIGLLKYKNGTLERIELGNVTEDNIFAVDLDKEETPWIAFNGGVIHYKLNGEYMFFDEKSGLATKKIGYRSILVDGKNRLWVQTTEGLDFCTDYHLEETSPTPCLVNMDYNGLEKDKVEFTFGFKEYLKFQFLAPSINRLSTQYQYRIKIGNDTSWIEMQDASVVISSLELNAGTYLLEVRAKQSGNYRWSAPLKVKFSIYHYWYQRWWVWVLLIFAAILIIYIGSRLYFWRLHQRSLELEHLVEQRTLEVTESRNEIQKQNETLTIVNEKLEKAKIQAEAGAAAKAQFVSNVTHEIRTPLNAVIGYSGLLLQNEPREDQMENIKILEFQAKNLLALVNDVLDFNKLEAGKVELEKAEFNLLHLLENITKTFTFNVKAKGITLELKYDPELPEWVRGDSLRLNQVLTNMIGNAVKFTSQGGVKLNVSKMGDLKGDKMPMIFEVHDSGIGIPANKLDAIFQGFTQASADISRRFGGTGLGLSISNKILKVMGSQMKVKSKEGVGSTFYFEVDMPISARNEEEQKRKLQEDKDKGTFRLDGRKVLLADDNDINIMITENILKKWGAIVTVAEDGKEAWEKIQKEDFDIVLMDLNMPIMNGFETVELVRKMPEVKYQKMPIIAFSASDMDDRDKKAIASGMNDFILKPFNQNELLSKIKQNLELWDS